ncbi:MAG: YggU family protein [Magnetococcales bacterium]|nr:YggU family protein [Magnetococcales bacterium]
MTVGHWQGEAWLLAVRVQPRASVAKIVGLQEDRLKVALTAPPVDGAANKGLCQLLAKELGVARGQITIVRGEKSREKQISVAGASQQAVKAFCLRYGLE